MMRDRLIILDMNFIVEIDLVSFSLSLDGYFFGMCDSL